MDGLLDRWIEIYKCIITENTNVPAVQFFSSWIAIFWIFEIEV